MSSPLRERRNGPDRLVRAELEIRRRHYNGVRLHAGIGYVTPDQEHRGQGASVRAARKRGLATARKRRIHYHRHHHTPDPDHAV